jgi:hypothetical protein
VSAPRSSRAPHPGRWGRSLARIAPLTLLALLSLFARGLGAQSGGRCGEERWPVKVLLDQDTARVNFNAEPTTIGALVGIPRPDSTRPTAARLPLELRTFRVRARLMDVTEQADGDPHLVLVDIDDSTQYLVAEIPDSACAPGSRHASDYAEAQRWARRTGRPIEVEIEGVAFWDDRHGQVGMARNGIELHPVLRVTPILTRSDILREEVGADPPEPTDVRVWVNTSSKVYHCPGSANYGTTARGEYMPESAARRSGARPAGGRRCE